jgi:DNA-binding response OmpR family regulator
MANKRILVVDDERPLANALNLKLKKEGFDVTVAYNGADCIKELQTTGADLILLDLMMPEVDGFAVLEFCQTLPKMPNVVVLSNLSQEEDMERVKKLGASGYFVKSNTPIREIIDYVIKLLQNEPPQ